MFSNKVFELNNLRKFDQKDFIIYRENKNDEQIFNYEELSQVVENLRQQFEANQLTPSSCFALELDISIDTVAIIISILNYGGHFCMVPTDVSDSFLDACEANYLLSNNTSVTRRFPLLKFQSTITAHKKQISLYIMDRTQISRTKPLDMCYTITTTGTTGGPKIVHVPYVCIASNISALCEKFQITCKDVIYLGTPFTFDPFVVELFMALATGAALLLTPEFNRNDSDILANILWPSDNRSAVTVLQMTPTNFRRFSLSCMKQTIFSPSSKLRILILGGEDFPRRTELASWLPKKLSTDVRIFNIYGITELSCWSTIHEWRANIEQERTPIGVPIDALTFLRIVDTNDGQVINGCGKGELFVGSVCRKSYIPQLDGDGIMQNPNDMLYRATGDLVERTVTGDIFYISRLNDNIKRSGKRISLCEIERKLESRLSTFGEVRIVLLWNEPNQNLICCLKVENEKCLAKVKRTILKYAAGHEKPDQIVVVKELPLDKHNKLDRRRLLEHVLNNSSLKEPIEIFQTFLKSVFQIDVCERKISTSTRKRLKIEPETLKSFIAAGGSSFQALSLATEIGERFTDPNDQRVLLKMLLDANTSIFDICDFLSRISFKNQKLAKATTSPVSSSNITPHKRKLKLLWRVYMEKCVDATPVLSPDSRSICIGSHASLLFNIEAAIGEVFSKIRLRDRIECQATFVSANLALVGCDAGYLYSIKISTGQIEWSLYVGCQVKAKPLVIDETFAIVGCYDPNFNLIGVCLEKHQVKWRKRIGSRPIYAAPILLDTNRVLVCTLDGTYECLNARTNETIWTKELTSPIFSTPKSINDGSQFIVAEVEGKVYLCQTETGLVLQTFHCDGNIFSSIKSYHKENSNLHIIFGCHDHYVYCLEYKNDLQESPTSFASLSLKWKTKLNSAIFSTPCVFEIFDEIFIVACSTKGLLVIMEYLNGRLVCEHNMENEVFSSICCVQTSGHDLRIFFGCRDDFLYCFEYN